MLAKLSSYTLIGIDAAPVEVEVDVSSASMPKTVLVGLAEAAVKESTHRVERAIVNSGYRRPDRPGRDQPRSGRPEEGRQRVRPADRPGAARWAAARSPSTGRATSPSSASWPSPARPGRSRASWRWPFRPSPRAATACSSPRPTPPRPPSSRGSTSTRSAAWPRPSASSPARSTWTPRRSTSTRSSPSTRTLDEDFVDVKGQDYAKRALLIAAAGCHNVLMIGPPGTGKTLLAKRLPTILPPLTPAESLETTRIYSAMGRLHAGPAADGGAARSARRTTRSATPAWSAAATRPSRGRSRMAHKGVLFLDEMPEFNRKTLEVLRQPLEEGKVTISRAMNSSTFPADFILVAAMNPCPCGYRSDPRRACSCTPPQVEKYLSRISGPLLDRIDLHVEVPAVPFTQLAEMPPGPDLGRVPGPGARRPRPPGRSGSATKGPQVNGRMTPRQVRKLCTLKPEAMSILKAAMEELGLSARAHDKVLRVARTIADLEGADEIKPQHIAEAVGYRSLDRSVWM